MMDGDYYSMIKQLRKIDRLFGSESTTVQDLLDQAIVAAEITDDCDSEGVLEKMFVEMIEMRKMIEQMNYELSRTRSADYWGQYHTNTPWVINTTTNTTGDHRWIDPNIIKTTRGTGK